MLQAVQCVTYGVAGGCSSPGKKKKNVIQQVLHNGQLFLTGWLADRLVWLIW